MNRVSKYPGDTQRQFQKRTGLPGSEPKQARGGGGIPSLLVGKKQPQNPTGLMRLLKLSRERERVCKIGKCSAVGAHNQKKRKLHLLDPPAGGVK